MMRIFITGSADGLGLISARALIAQGHSVTLHARTALRGEQALQSAPGASGLLIGDLSSIPETKALAAEANKSPPFDVIMHNAGVGFTRPYTTTPVTPDGKGGGIATEFAVNTLAPYILTALMHKPLKRLIYLSSGLHNGGDASLHDVTWRLRGAKEWDGQQAYSDTKLQDVMLAFAMARRWPDVEVNACSPGWVKTRMGGSGAPGGAEEGAKTQIFLAGTGEKVGTERYWVGGKVGVARVEAGEVERQEELLRVCGVVSGVSMPS